MDDCLEERLVGKDDSGLATIGDAIAFFEPGRDVTGLDIVCGGRDDGDIFRGVFVGVLNHCRTGTKEVDEGLFYGVEEVEADKDEGRCKM